MATLSGPLRIPPHVRSVIDSDGAVVLDAINGTYYSLNGVGVEVWTRIEAGMTLPEIREAIAAAYDVAPDLVAHDVERFVSRLRDKALVRPSD